MTTVHPRRGEGTASAGFAVLAAVLVLVAMLGLPVPAEAKPKPTPKPPQLSVAIEDGQDAAGPSDKLDYTITVSNLGTAKVRHLLISQTIPAHTTLVSAGRGTAKSGTVTWDVDVAAGKKAILRTALTVGTGLPGQLLRLATVACVRTSAKAAPVVCASDSDLLPAGAVVQQERQRLAQHAAARSPWLVPGLVGLGVVVVAAAAVTAVWWRRRARRHGHRSSRPARASEGVD